MNPRVAPTPIPFVNPRKNPTPAPAPKKGEDNKVMEYQKYINSQIEKSGVKYPKLVVDGMWGNKTQDAYEKFVALKEMKEVPTKPTAERVIEKYIPTARPSGPEQITVKPMDITRPYGITGPPTLEQWEATHPMKEYGGYYAQGGINNPGFRALPESVQQKIMDNMAYGGEYAQGGNFMQGVRNMIRRPRRESSEEMMQQVMQNASDNFKREGNPEKVLNYIQNQGVSQEAAMQMLQQIVNGVENSDEYARGGGIHINPAKKGTFTAQATRMNMGVQEAARHILANKDRYSPAMVKKANFARNASKWKHDDGGYVNMYEDGGEAQQQSGASQEQMLQQLMQMVSQALGQGHSPQEVMQMLVQQGIPQETATQIIQSAGNQ
jgi:SOS response regulatory protein OraA/RecX